jgi:hypothetical protein
VRLAEVVAALIVRDWIANGASDAIGSWVRCTTRTSAHRVARRRT